MAVNLKANMLMIMDKASPCMVSFVKGMLTRVALSSMWVMKTSEPHEGVMGNGVSKACKRKMHCKRSRGKSDVLSKCVYPSVQKIA